MQCRTHSSVDHRLPDGSNGGNRPHARISPSAPEPPNWYKDRPPVTSQLIRVRTASANERAEIDMEGATGLPSRDFRDDNPTEE
jgi:hypothetical protein